MIMAATSHLNSSVQETSGRIPQLMSQFIYKERLQCDFAVPGIYELVQDSIVELEQRETQKYIFLQIKDHSGSEDKPKRLAFITVVFS